MLPQCLGLISKTIAATRLKALSFSVSQSDRKNASKTACWLMVLFVKSPLVQPISNFPVAIYDDLLNRRRSPKPHHPISRRPSPSPQSLLVAVVRSPIHRSPKRTSTSIRFLQGPCSSLRLYFQLNAIKKHPLQ